MAVSNIDGDGNLLADAFADGYEASTTISTLINGNIYFGDQRDINAAIVKIITDDSTLNKLLTAEISTNNTLVITSLTGGDFNTDDLEITLAQKPATTATFASAVLAEAEVVFKNSSLTLTQLWGSETPASDAAYVGENDGAGALGNDATVTTVVEQFNYYTGLGVDNATLHTGSTASTVETDTTINGGAGNDVIVMSTDAIGGGVPAYTVSSNNRLLNGASNETIKLEDTFGNDVVMNFTANPLDAGVDFLDYSDYLISQASASGSNASKQLIPVTIAADVAGVVANEVSVIRFDNTDAADTSEIFGSLTATQIASLFNFKTGDKLGTNTQYGNLVAGTFSVKANYDDESTTASPKIDLIDGKGKAVVMVENADNLGFYKVFELSWYGGEKDVTSTHTVTAVDLGSLDFGTTLTGMTDISLTGSAANAALSLATGVVPVTFAVTPAAATVNEGASATFNVVTTGLADGSYPYTLGGTVSPADVTGGLSGNVTITAGVGTITAALVADATTEGAETITATIGGVTSTAVAVNDTSVTPGAFVTVNLAAGGAVVATAAAEAFVYDFAIVAGRATGSGDGEASITGFDPATDKLVFNDVGAGTVLTEAQFKALAGVSISESPFAPIATTVYFDPAGVVASGVTLVGIADAALATIVVETTA